VSFIARHTFSLISVTIFAFFTCLVLWAYNHDLEHALQQPTGPTYPTEQRDIIIAYHNRPNIPHIGYALANTLTKNPIKKLAFTLLIACTPQHKVITAYAHYTQFGSVQSLPKAARNYFGVSVEHLSIGETLLLLELAQNPHLSIATPITAIQKRDALLSDLYNHHTLTQTQYQTEHQKALALVADHKPIN
jgi:hypothetical protein